MGFLSAILSCQVFLVVVLIYLGFHSLGSQPLLEDAPLALRLNFGPSVEFWIRLLLLKTQVHVVIALGMTRGTNTKTPPTHTTRKFTRFSKFAICRILDELYIGDDLATSHLQTHSSVGKYILNIYIYIYIYSFLVSKPTSFFNLPLLSLKICWDQLIINVTSPLE